MLESVHVVSASAPAHVHPRHPRNSVSPDLTSPESSAPPEGRYRSTIPSFMCTCVIVLAKHAGTVWPSDWRSAWWASSPASTSGFILRASNHRRLRSSDPRLPFSILRLKPTQSMYPRYYQHSRLNSCNVASEYRRCAHRVQQLRLRL